MVKLLHFSACWLAAWRVLKQFLICQLSSLLLSHQTYVDTSTFSCTHAHIRRERETAHDHIFGILKQKSVYPRTRVESNFRATHEARQRQHYPSWVSVNSLLYSNTALLTVQSLQIHTWHVIRTLSWGFCSCLFFTLVLLVPFRLDVFIISICNSMLHVSKLINDDAKSSWGQAPFIKKRTTQGSAKNSHDVSLQTAAWDGLCSSSQRTLRGLRECTIVVARVHLQWWPAVLETSSTEWSLITWRWRGIGSGRLGGERTTISRALTSLLSANVKWEVGEERRAEKSKQQAGGVTVWVEGGRGGCRLSK